LLQNVLCPTAYLILGLAKAGYPLETCRQLLTAVEGDEALAAENLFRHLLGLEDKEDSEAREEHGVWSEEQTPLKEIYGSRFEVISTTRYRIRLSPPDSPLLPSTITLELDKPRNYPHSFPPHLILSSEPKLPSHVRLSVIRQVGHYAWETLRGSAMVWALADWIEANIERIIRNPGRLSDLDGVVSGEALHLSPPFELLVNGGFQPKKDIDWTPRPTSVEISVSESRKTLPAWKHHDEIVSICRSNRVIVVTGETGSGKSTQLPQYLLDDFLSCGLGHAVNIICTQPRRISAIGLAERVSDERGEKVGMTVGYSIRGETKGGSNTKLRFVTTGVLLRRFLGDPDLGGVTHVLVDEVHERTVDGDFLLLLLKDLLAKRKDIAVIMMSATVEAEDYATYFSQFTVGRVHIEGRTFPVRDINLDSILTSTGYRPPLRKFRRDRDLDYEEGHEEPGIRDALHILDEGTLDYDLIAKTVESVFQDDLNGGGILIFMPGTLD
jgi:ATP-dependent RNA helicase DHX57